MKFFFLLPTHKTLKISGLFSRRISTHSLIPIFNMPKHRRRKDSDVDNTEYKDKFVTTQNMRACAKGSAALVTNLLDIIWKWVISCKFGPLYSRGKTPRYLPKTAETREGLEVLYKENVICSCRDSKDDSLVNLPMASARKNVRDITFFISPFIVPPVLLQTIRKHMSLLMTSRKIIQWFFSY